MKGNQMSRILSTLLILTCGLMVTASKADGIASCYDLQTIAEKRACFVKVVESSDASWLDLADWKGESGLNSSYALRIDEWAVGANYSKDGTFESAGATRIKPFVQFLCADRKGMFSFGAEDMPPLSERGKRQFRTWFDGKRPIDLEWTEFKTKKKAIIAGIDVSSFKILGEYLDSWISSSEITFEFNTAEDESKYISIDTRTFSTVIFPVLLECPLSKKG